MNHPRVVGRPPSDAYIGLSLLHDGELRHYDYGQQRERAVELSHAATGWLSSRDEGETWHWQDAPAGFIGADVRSPVSGEYIRVYSRDGSLYSVRSEGGAQGYWRESKILNGSYLMVKPPEFIRDGKRIVVALHHQRLRGQPLYRETMGAQTGCCVLLSDDDGLTWRASPFLTTPDHGGGSPHRGVRWNHGAVEPSVVELSDGRLWMLIRTPQDVFYESFSTDGGDTWDEPQPSRFHATCTMPVLGKLQDGRLLLLWNNCAPLPERASANGMGEDVFTNRDAIHAAVSDDDGASWRGFRELALDEHRHAEDYAQTGGIDRSMQQAQFVQLPDGHIVASVGQHPLHRILIKFHPDWLLETGREALFDLQMSEFSTQSYLRGIQGHAAYDRKPGATMIAHPEDGSRMCLQVRRRRDPDLIDERGGLVWNFPALDAGSMTIRLRLSDSFGGARLTLTDRWFNPTDPIVHEMGPLSLDIPADGRMTGELSLRPGQWHEIRIEWTSIASAYQHPGALLSLDGQCARRRLGVARGAPNGLSYLHLASTAAAEDGGLLIDQITTGLFPE